jgi:hypothetical protein
MARIRYGFGPRLATCLVALSLGLATAQPGRADFDLTGDWYVGVESSPVFFSTFTQTGTSLVTDIAGSGTIDPVTGAFNLLLPLPPPDCGASFGAQVDPTGETFTGIATLYSFTGGCVCCPVQVVEFLGSRSPCGNGVVDAGEDCDDGNLGQSDACCSLGCSLLPAGSDCANDGNVCTADTCDAGGICTHPAGNPGTICRPAAHVCDMADACDGMNTACPADAPQPDGTDCSDGLFCNGPETTCQAGGCQTGSPPCPILCDEGADQCLAGCLPAPLTCRAAEKSILQVRNSDPTTSDKLTWKWLRGEATSQAEFGDPTDTAGYAFCLYAGTSATLIGEAIVPADAAKWSTVLSKGYKFRDNDSGSINRILLKGSSEDRSKIRVTGAGAGLPDLALPTSAPLTVQLVHGESGLCWGASYASPHLLENGPTRLKAKAP